MLNKYFDYPLIAVYIFGVIRMAKVQPEGSVAFIGLLTIFLLGCYRRDELYKLQYDVI